MKQELSASPRDMAPQLERLVCGELDEPDRRSLLAWLDEEPRRWRLCGLLFLEAQTWSQALAEWPGRSETESPVTLAANTESPGSHGRWRRMRDVAVLAASIMAAFVLGAAIQHRGFWDYGTTADRVAGGSTTSDTNLASASADNSPVMARLRMASSAGVRLQPAVHISVVPRNEAKVNRKDSAEEIPDYVRKQWERRGYHLDVERRYLLAKLPNGEQVAVPFEQYAIKPIHPKIN
jgi:hypothetical protein